MMEHVQQVATHQTLASVLPMPTKDNQRAARVLGLCPNQGIGITGVHTSGDARSHLAKMFLDEFCKHFLGTLYGDAVITLDERLVGARSFELCCVELSQGMYHMQTAVSDKDRGEPKAPDTRGRKINADEDIVV